MKKKPASKIIVNKRVLEVLEAILEGGNTHEIVIHFASEFGVSERQVYTYIKKANKMFLEYSKTNIEGEIGKAFARLNKLFNKSLQIMDFKTCLAVQKEINDILGLNKNVRNINVSQEIKIIPPKINNED